MSILIFRDIIDVGTGPRDWRVMMAGEEFVCSRDNETLRTCDRDEAARFLANSSEETALARAYQFLLAVAPLHFSTTTRRPD